MADEERPVEEATSPIRAPELSGAVAWLNVPAPLSLKALRGKVVLLDFWTYGCINCIHIIPDLQKLEERFPDELVVIGVHAAKFTNEKATENIRQIIRRYGIRHPVANDAEFRIWRAYTVRAWPSRVIIDPAGYVVGAASGEGNYEGFEQAIESVIRVFDERGQIDRTPLALKLEHEGAAETPLMFPGKVLATADRLYVSDSNHHQIAVMSHDGAVLDRVGAGTAGRRDGDFAVAEFNTPQGLAMIDGRLWVADTNNHLIRSVDFERRTVTTEAGTGVQCTWREDGGRATTVALNSPWDLAVNGPLLFIAMAGPHQIWMMEHTRGILWPYAGSGQEARLDGSIESAAFAQPSGLALDDGVLYVADAESNIIRAIDLPPKNEVRTLVGRRPLRVRRQGRQGGRRAAAASAGCRRARRADRDRRHLQPQDQAAGSREAKGVDAGGHRNARTPGRLRTEGAVLRAGRGVGRRRHDLRRGHEQPCRPRGGCQDGGDADGGGK